MSWFILFLAGVFEVGWAVSLKLTDGLARPWILTGTVVALLMSTVLLSVAIRGVPLGTAYAVWTGIGAAGTFAAAVFFFDEPVNVVKVLSILCIIAGLVGLKVGS